MFICFLRWVFSELVLLTGYVFWSQLATSALFRFKYLSGNSVIGADITQGQEKILVCIIAYIFT